MKRLKASMMIAFLFMLTGSAIAQDPNYLTFPDFSVKQGDQYTLNIEMINTNLIRYGEFKLSLPTGLSVAKIANPDYDPTDPSSEPLIYDVALVRVNGHDIACNEVSPNLYGFVFSSMNKAVPGTSGTFVTVNLVADAAAAPGIKDLLLKDVILVSSATSGFEPADKILKVTIIPTHVNISFDAQGGSAVDPVKIVYETPVTEPTAPTRTGYTFDGWYKEAAYTTKWNFADNVMADMTLYAKWKINSYAITTTTSPAGKGSVSGAGTFDYNTEITVTAAPVTGYELVNWTDEGTPVSTALSYTFPVEKARNLVANFKIQSIAITASPSIPAGGSVTGSTSYDYGSSVTLTATPNTGYDFLNWTEGGVEVGTGLTYTLTANKARTLVANFKIQSYVITAPAIPVAGGSVTGGGTYEYGKSVSLVAAAKTGYDFVNWTEEGTEVSKALTLAFTAEKARTLVANFKIQNYAIAVSALPADKGSVTGGGSFDYNTDVTLTATAVTGYKFVNWTEGITEVSKANPYTYKATKAQTLVANFAIETYAIAASATTGGSVTGGATYDHGASVSLVATPATGYDFVNWTEGGVEVSTALTYTFTADKARTLVANFKIQSYVIAASVLPADKGSVTGAGTYEYGKSVSLVATPATGYDFVNWTEGGVEVSTALTYTFTADKARTLVANFKIQSYVIAASAAPAAGGSVTGGATYDYGTSVSLVATVATGYDFVNWTEGGTEVSTALTYTFTADKARTLVANFKIQSYAIAASATTGGRVTGGATYDYGTSVSLVATPATGYDFVNWTEGGVEASAALTYTFTADKARSLVANFKIQNYAIAASVLPADKGSVTGGGSFDYNTDVTLTATPVTGYKFVNWTEGGVEVSKANPYTYKATKAQTLVANFVIETYAIDVTAVPTAGGSLTGAGTYEYGTSVSLVATPATGYDFVNWTEGDNEVSKDLTYAFTADKALTLVANFKIQSYVIAASVLPADKGSVTGAGTYEYGKSVSLVATPATGYDFVNWTEGGVEVSTALTYTFTADKARTLVANFKIQSYVIAASAAPAAGGSVTGGATYEYGTSVSLVATPATGYDFVNWTEGGVEVSTALTYTFTADKARTLVANFKIQSYVIAASATTGGSVTGAATYDYGTSVSLVATPATGYDFVNWTEGGVEVSKDLTFTFTADKARTLVANFKIQNYAIAASVLPADKGSVTGGGSFDYNTDVTLTATPVTGYKFVNWTEGGVEVSKANPYTYKATKAQTLVANFVIETYAIDVTAVPTAGGSVTGAATYDYGTSVSLVATAATGYDFVNWTEGGVEVSKDLTFAFTADKARTLVANFKIQSYVIAASVLPADKGSVTGGGSFDYNTDVTLTATPVTGYKFVNWTEGGVEVSKSNPYTYKATKAQTLVANFVIETYAIDVTAVPTAGGSVTGAGTYEYGSSVSLVATPATGYDFVNWTEGGTEVSTALTYTFTADKARTLVANFKIQSYVIAASAVPTAGGSVTGGASYDYGTSVSLVATAATGYDFVNWTEGGVEVSKDLTFTFTADKARTLVANFKIQSYDVVVEIISEGFGTVTGAGTYEYGSKATLVATPAEGYVFDKWIVNGVETTDLTLEITVTAAVSVQAQFSLFNGIEGAEEGAVTVFPTVVKNDFTIAHAEAYKMNVYDNNGRLILSKIVTDAAYVISASDWTSGIYHILLTNGKRVVKERIVKK